MTVRATYLNGRGQHQVKYDWLLGSTSKKFNFANFIYSVVLHEGYVSTNSLNHCMSQIRSYLSDVDFKFIYQHADSYERNDTDWLEVNNDKIYPLIEKMINRVIMAHDSL